MAIDNETSLYTAENVLSTKPNEELRNQNKDTTTETVTQPTVVTPTNTTSAPVFNRDQRVALTLLPLASALLQGKTQGGQSQLSGLLASTGQGLAGSANAALQIAQLEAQSAKTKTTTPKQYVLQEGFEGKVDVGGKQYGKEDNIVFNFTPEQINAYPQGTFMEYTKPTTDKATSKEMFVEKEFEIDGIKYGVGTREIPQAVINKQLAIDPNVFGAAPDESKLDSDFRGYAFVDEIFEKEMSDGEGKTKIVKESIIDDNAYPIIQEGDKFFVLYKNGEKIPYNELQSEGRVSSIFTASQYDKARGKIPDDQFFKMEDKLEETKQTILTFNDMFDVILRGGETFEGKKNSIMARVKIFSGQQNKLTDAEKAQLEKEGSLRRLIGQSRLALFGPGVLTEFEQALAKVALVGNPDFAVIDVVKRLLTRASRSEISKYDLLGKRVQNQRRKRREPGDKTQPLFDYTKLPLYREEESFDENDTGGNPT